MDHNQPKAIFQFTGLSGSGKTTLAGEVKKLLLQKGHSVEVLDGDVMRKTISSDLGFSRADRLENIRRIAQGAKESQAGIVLIAAINPYHEGRKYLKEYCNAKLIWLRCDLQTLKKRDTKGLYKKALLQENDPRKLKNLTGVNDPFETPENADCIIPTDTEEVESSALHLLNYVLSSLNLSES